MRKEECDESRGLLSGGRYFQMISKSYQMKMMFFEKKVKI